MIYDLIQKNDSFEWGDPDEEKEDDGDEVKDPAPEKEKGTSEREVSGEPLQQMPASQTKEDTEKEDDKASWTKIELVTKVVINRKKLHQ